MSEFVAFVSGLIFMMIVWYRSDNDDRRQYRIGYRDGYCDGSSGSEMEEYKINEI